MIVFDLCLSPMRGLSIRERREFGRGDVDCGRSDSEEEEEDEEEPLDIEGDKEWRGGMSPESESVIGTASGRGARNAQLKTSPQAYTVGPVQVLR